MVSVVAFSGWGQEVEALRNVVPDAVCYDYLAYQKVSESIENIGCKRYDIAVGWSLGGQFAIRAIKKGRLKVDKLVLIATPFNFIADNVNKCAMRKSEFEKFRKDFTLSPDRTLERFNLFVAKNDSHRRQIFEGLKSYHDSSKLLYWLDQLASFSCSNVNFSGFPDTHIIHGQDDAVVDFVQVSLFAALIESVKTHIIDKCSHAVHLHDPQRVKQIIYGQ